MLNHIRLKNIIIHNVCLSNIYTPSSQQRQKEALKRRSSEAYSGIHNFQRSGYPLQLKNCKDDQNKDLLAVFRAFILVHHLG